MFIEATMIHLKTFITFFPALQERPVIIHASFSGGTQVTCQAHAKASTISCCTSFASLVQFVLRLMNLECNGYFDLWQCIFQGQQSHQIKLNISVPVLMGERSFGISLLTALNQSIHRARWTLSLTKNYLDCSMTFPVGLHLSLSVLINSLMVSLISASICIWICIIWTENVMIYNCSPSSLLTLGKAPATLST